MNNYIFKNWAVAAALVVFFLGCGDSEVKVTRNSRGTAQQKNVKIEKPEKIETPDYEYKGIKHRSPFSKKGGTGRSSGGTSGTNIPGINPERLIVSGVMEDTKDQYGMLTGPDGFFMVKDGRIYNEDGKEIPGVAAIIKNQKVVLITDENTTYELPIPE
ncbi:MAG: hypothetical protein ACQEQC_03075 [Elusimicrobiota bacterium]